MFRFFDQLFRSYSVYEIAIELLVIWLFVYLVVRFLRGTRGAGVIKGVAVMLVVVTLLVRVLSTTSDAFDRLIFIYDRFLALLAILLIVVFQQELRQAMIRLGHARIFRGSRSAHAEVVDPVAEAVEFLSKSQFGALIAIEREVKLGGLISGGEMMDARISARLLESIFWPNSPLHDLGVVIREDRIVAANVQFPLSEDTALPPQYGSRHRAAVGVSLESDCIVVVVSEETGEVSIAEGGRLDTRVPRDKLGDVLSRRLIGYTRRRDDAPAGTTVINAGQFEDAESRPDATGPAATETGANDSGPSATRRPSIAAEEPSS